MAFVGALVGVFIGIGADYLLYSGPGPGLTDVATLRSNKPGAGSEMCVQILGYEAFTKQSADPHAFDVEAELWASPDAILAFAIICTAGYLGWRIAGRYLGSRAELRVPAITADEIADYRDVPPPSQPNP